MGKREEGKIEKRRKEQARKKKKGKQIHPEWSQRVTDMEGELEYTL